MDSNQDNEITDEYDKEFINLLMGKLNVLIISINRNWKANCKTEKAWSAES